MKTELAQYSHRRESTGPYADDLDVDVIIVGGGFGEQTSSMIPHHLSLTTHLRWGLLSQDSPRAWTASRDLRGGSGFGWVRIASHYLLPHILTVYSSTWRWNRYPGARVDSEVPEYQFSWPEVYKDWTWTTNYPNYEELRAYFDHVDKVFDIKKDCSFETVVVGAQFDVDEGKWHVKTEDGRLSKSKHFIVAAGFVSCPIYKEIVFICLYMQASKRYIPLFKGLDKFKGIIHHSSFWPEEGVDAKGKRCAVIGTGASGVQIAQEWGPQVGSMKVYQRTPNLAVPMQKRMLTAEEQNRGKEWYHRLYEYREKCFGGFFYTMYEKNTFDDTPADRDAFYHKLWDYGGFRFWLGNYKDMLINADANKEAYAFWAKHIRDRIGDARTRDILAPLELPHYFGVKRPCLEQNYYEQFNRPNVDIVDIKNNPIAEFTETGIKLEDGSHEEFDIICIATGFVRVFYHHNSHLHR